MSARWSRRRRTARRPAPAAKPAAATPTPEAPKPAPPAAKAAARPEPPPAKPQAAAAPSTKLLASPLAKTLAVELGVDLRTVTGSGPGGRIVERDVKAASGGAAATAPAAAAAHAAEPTEDDTKATMVLATRSARQLVPEAAGDYDDVPASNMRKRIAARLTEAKRDIPHFYLQRPIDAAPLMGFRGRLDDLLGDRGKVSVNDLVIKAVALALRRVPECNASWTGDAIRHHHRVHVGVAVAIEDGLVTAGVRDADQKGIGSIAAEVRDLADRAKTRALKGHEIRARRSPSATSACSASSASPRSWTRPRPASSRSARCSTRRSSDGGSVVAGKRMTVSMSCDHRVIDGATGARWLAAFADLLEKPESLAL